MDDFADDFEYDEVPIIPKDVNSIEEFQSRYRKSVGTELVDSLIDMSDSGTVKRLMTIKPRPIKKYIKEDGILNSRTESCSEEELKMMNLALKDFNELDSKTRKWLAALGYSEEFYNTLNTEARWDTLRCLVCTAKCKYRELYDSLS